MLLLSFGALALLFSPFRGGRESKIEAWGGGAGMVISASFKENTSPHRRLPLPVDGRLRLQDFWFLPESSRWPTSQANRNSQIFPFPITEREFAPWSETKPLRLSGLRCQTLALLAKTSASKT